MQGNQGQNDFATDVVVHSERTVTEKVRSLKWLIDTVQEIGIAESSGKVPEVVFSKKYHAFLSGFYETFKSGILFVSLYYLLEFLFTFLEIFTGYDFLRFVFYVLILLSGVFFVLKPAGKLVFASRVVRKFVVGPASHSVWKWFVRGFASGIVLTFFFVSLISSGVKIFLAITVFSRDWFLHSFASLLARLGALDNSLGYSIAQNVVYFFQNSPSVFLRDLLFLVLVSFLLLAVVFFFGRLSPTASSGVRDSSLFPDDTTSPFK